jgi:hypothetical protein
VLKIIYNIRVFYLFQCFNPSACSPWSVIVTSNVMAERAIDLLKQFYTQQNPNAPQPKDKSKRKKCDDDCEIK